ncbi:hypothetical protein RHMOL_Rhmol09G0208500 [Rhododendron molle]|uniref:Uncharacterized protein n=1 Tax=Rhododendron molle TaxID=49168 RepID=A0ACC0MFE3_RHOML|nr:hypothetical protein RHMOL_Rhmol09G0208500 [Rhododendron molle]
MLSTDDGGSHATGACESIALSDDNIPEWAQLLEPVRKLPTNVRARIRKCTNDALEEKQFFGYHFSIWDTFAPQLNCHCSNGEILKEHLEKAGCGFGEKFINAVHCDKEISGGYTHGEGVHNYPKTTPNTTPSVSFVCALSPGPHLIGALVSHAFELDSKVRTLFYRAPAVITFCVPTKAALQVGHWSDGASILLRGVRAEVCWITNQKPSEKDEWYTAWNIRCWAEEYRSYTLLLASLTAYNLRFWCLHRHSLTMNVLEGSLLGIIIVLCFYAKILSTNISLRTSIVIRC